jgi:PAS domain S-box-containing protein
VQNGPFTHEPHRTSGEPDPNHSGGDAVKTTRSADGSTTAKTRLRPGWFRLLAQRSVPVIEARYRYGVAIGLVFVAAAVRLAFLQVLGTRAAFVTFYPAVMLAGLFGGLRAGLLATVLSALAADYFWIGPPGFAIEEPGDWVALAVFLVSCTMICAITETMHRARARATAAEAEAKIAAERQRSAEVLRESEERYRTLFNTLIEGFCIVEVIFDDRARPIDYRFLEVNPAFENQTGLHDAPGKLMRELAPDHEVHWFEIYGKVALTGEPARFVSEARALNHWYDVSAFRVGGTESRKVAILFNDVTERIRAEEQLRELSQRLSYHVDHSPLAVIEWGPDMRLIRWSDEAERLFGWKAAEVLGKRMEDFRWIYFEDERQVAQVSADLQKGSNPHPFSANRNYRKDGSVAHCEWYNSSLRDQSGKLRSILSLVLDVTERKQAEQALLQAQVKLKDHAENLEKTVTSRTAKLHETIAELEHFSYAVVHDLRAPLRTMQGFAEMTEEECAGCERTFSKDCLRRIKVASNRMDQLIGDCLNFSKAARQELVLKPVDLFQLLDGLVETYPNLQPDKADIQIEPNLPTVLGNEAALTQCFSNLLGNAVKFAKAGAKPQIRVRAEPSPAASTAASIRASNRFVRLWVEDNGIGIPKDAQQRIFGMFQRATTDREGTGIGLAIVRKVVERMGGTVGVESAEGQGSRFWVELPRFTTR